VRVAYGTDEQTEGTRALLAELRERGHEVTVVAEGQAWPEVGRAVGEAVTQGVADRGVVWCWTGTGVAIAATKVPGVRAASCTDAETARGARRWNDANVCALSLRLVSVEIAREVLGAFLSTEPDPDEAAAIARIDPVVGRPPDGRPVSSRSRASRSVPGGAP